MSFLQVLILIFILFVLSRVLLKYSRRDISFKEWLLWSIFWVAVGVAAVLPKTTDLLASQVGLATGRGVDLAVYVSIPVLFYIIFRLFAKLDKMDEEITRITRHIALEDSEQDDKDRKD